jgi:hypothetical protein
MLLPSKESARLRVALTFTAGAVVLDVIDGLLEFALSHS